MTTRLAGLAPAIDGVTAQVNDLDHLVADTTAGGVAVQIDGRMVDLPVVRTATRLVRQARAA